MITELFFQGGLFSNIVVFATICLAAGLAGSFALRRSAARAHQVLLLAMLAAALVPLGGTAVRHYELGLLKATPDLARPPAEYSTITKDLAVLRPVEIEPVATGSALAQESVRPAYTAPTSNTGPGWGLILARLWAVATLVLLLRLLVTFILGRRLLKTAAEVGSEPIRRAAALAREKLHITRPVRVLTSQKIKSPLVWCWAARPVLLVPSGTTSRCEDIDWAGTFCHELAHLKRLDHLSGLFAELLVCALPWHPLAWWAKHRLSDLSEQACDDWVVAAGRCGRHYARSLLELVPQSRPDFLPAVVAGRRQLPGRIRRILQNRCASPRPGVRWATAAMLVTVALAVTLAFAQPSPAGGAWKDHRDRPEQHDADRDREFPPEARELQAHGQELQHRAAEIQERLRNLSPEQDEEARDLRAELAEIHRELERIADELREAAPERFAGGRRAELREVNPHVRELLGRRRELQRLAEELADGLRELPEDHPERPRLARRLDEVRQELEAIEAELRRAPGPQPPEGLAPHITELVRHRHELQKRAEQIEAELRELAEDHPGRRELSAELREIGAELGDVEWRLRAARQGATFRAPEQRPRREMLEMLEHRRELQARAARLERELAGAGDSPQAERIRNELREIHRNIERIDAELRPPRAERRRRGAPELERHLAELHGHAENLEEQLRRIGDSDPGKAEALEAELRRVHSEIERLQHQVHPELPGPPEREPRPRELERQVDELRGQVRRMQEQMAEIRQLLERLLERDRPQRTARPRRPEAEELER